MSFCFWTEGKCWLAIAFFCWRFTFVCWGESVHVEIYSNLLIVYKWIFHKDVSELCRYERFVAVGILRFHDYEPFSFLEWKRYCTLHCFHLSPYIYNTGGIPIGWLNTLKCWNFQCMWQKASLSKQSVYLAWGKIITLLAVIHVNAVRTIIQPPIRCSSSC